MAVLKSTEHDVTLTSFVADLSHPGILIFHIMCEIGTRERADNEALIFAFVQEISQENERGTIWRRILLSSTVTIGSLATHQILAKLVNRTMRYADGGGGVRVRTCRDAPPHP